MQLKGLQEQSRTVMVRDPIVGKVTGKGIVLHGMAGKNGNGTRSESRAVRFLLVLGSRFENIVFGFYGP